MRARLGQGIELGSQRSLVPVFQPPNDRTRARARRDLIELVRAKNSQCSESFTNLRVRSLKHRKALGIAASDPTFSSWLGLCSASDMRTQFPTVGDGRRYTRGSDRHQRPPPFMRRYGKEVAKTQNSARQPWDK